MPAKADASIIVLADAYDRAVLQGMIRKNNKQKKKSKCSHIDLRPKQY